MTHQAAVHIAFLSCDIFSLLYSHYCNPHFFRNFPFCYQIRRFCSNFLNARPLRIYIYITPDPEYFGAFANFEKPEYSKAKKLHTILRKANELGHKF